MVTSWYSRFLEAVSSFCCSLKRELSSQILLWKMGNTRLGSSYASPNIKHNEWSLKSTKWTGECLPTPPQLCPHTSGGCVSPRCAGTASLSHGQEFITTGWQSYHSSAGSHPLPLCWEGNLEVWRRERDSEHLVSGEICSCVALGAGLSFAMGTGRSSTFRSEAQPCSWLTEIRALLQICMKLVTIKCSSASRSSAENISHQEVIWGNLGKRATNSFACNTMCS